MVWRPLARRHLATMLHQAKRIRLDEEGVLDVRAWLADHARGSQVAVSQPVQLTGWTKASATEGGSITYGSTAGLLAFRPLRPPVDLNQGREKYVPKGGLGASGAAAADKGMVETVLQAALTAGAPLADCDVLTFRNNLNKVFGTPLDPGASWAVDGCWRGSTLFLDIVQLEQQWRGSAADAEKFVYWGYRFEAACTGQAVTDATSEYGILVRTRIGGLRIYLGAEVDCYDPATCAGVCGAKAAGLASLVELKTYRLPSHPKQQFTLHRHKHPKWWIQSYLAGVPTLALGGRDDQGIVQRIDLVNVGDLPKISAASGAGWDPQLSLRFGAHCLGWFKGVAAAHPGRHLRFSYDGASRAVQFEVLADGDLPGRLERALAAKERG